MHGNSELDRKFVQILQIARPVDVGKKAWLPVTAPLHDMLGDAEEIQSGGRVACPILRSAVGPASFIQDPIR